jgi:hypothetical protein
MFGNRLGWGISAVIVIFAGLLGRLVYQIAQPSPPTGWIDSTIQPITSPGSVDPIIPNMTGNRNAGDFYRKAISDYRQNPAAYDTVANGKPPTVSAVPGVRALIDATQFERMDLFRSDPRQVINYEHDKEPLFALHQVAHATVQVALRNNPTIAGRCYTAVLSLGIKLQRERVVYDELAVGEELMGIACDGLKSLAHRANDTAREQQIDQFDMERLTTNAAEVQPVWAVLGSVDMNTISAYAGDWFALSKNRNVDPLWQVEGVLKLGQLKYSAARLADQKAAQRLLTELAGDPNETPAIRAAAAAGRDLTIEQYRSLR